MTQQEATVFVIDDEEQPREAVCALVRSMQYPAQGFASGEDFLRQYDGAAGCLVTDYRLSGMNGLQVQQQLEERDCDLPIIVITAYARTPVTVQAIQKGAVTLLDKPCNEDELWNAIREGLTQDEKRRQEKLQQLELSDRLANLTEKEQQVLQLLMEGEPNKAMASKLDVSLRTIENRRRTVFSKVGARTVAELVTLVLNHKKATGI